MAVENTTLMIMIGLFFNYFILYNKNRFFGNIVYIMTGLGIAYMGNNMANAWDQNIVTFIGIIIFISSLINTIYDVLVKQSISK